MFKKAIVISGVLVLQGCSLITPVKTDYKPGTFTSIIVSSVAINSLESTPTPAPAPDDEKRHPRAQCPTGGWITHGDGHKTPCPYCDPPYTGQDTPATVTVLEEKTLDTVTADDKPPQPQARTPPVGDPLPIPVQPDFKSEPEPKSTSALPPAELKIQREALSFDDKPGHWTHNNEPIDVHLRTHPNHVGRYDPSLLDALSYDQLLTLHDRLHEGTWPPLAKQPPVIVPSIPMKSAQSNTRTCPPGQPCPNQYAPRKGIFGWRQQ